MKRDKTRMKIKLGRYKHFLMRAINVCILVSVCFGYHQIASVRAQKEAEIQRQNEAVESTWQDGMYEGVGTGFGGRIIVNVTVKQGSIEEIQIIEAKGEDTAYLDNAKKIIQTMYKNQTAEVDVASGATYSSNGIIEAVRNALEEAS